MRVTSSGLTPSSCDGGDLFRVHPTQALFLAAKIKEQLALRFRRRDLHDAPVAQNELMHLRLDPVDGEGHEAHAEVRVEALDGLHEAHVSFLDEVSLLQDRIRNRSGRGGPRSAGGKHKARERRRDHLRRAELGA